MLKTLEATLDGEGKIHFLEKVELQGTHRVLVTLLDASGQKNEMTKQESNTGSVLAFLRENRLPNESRLTAEEIDAQIENERNGWED